MRMFHSLICILLLFSACTKNQELKIENQQFYQKTSLPCPEHNCTEASINIPVVIAPKNFVADSINIHLLKTISQLVSFDEESKDVESYNSILNSFIQSYEDIRKEFPKDRTPWVAKIKGEVIHQTQKLLSIELEHYVFSGGAHGYRGFKAFNFDPENGHLYTTKELFGDLDGFSKLVENRLRTELNVPENSPINSTGLMFENDVFKLSENIFFYENKLVVYYNTYEIASYADGPLALDFTYEEVYPFINLLK